MQGIVSRTDRLAFFGPSAGCNLSQLQPLGASRFGHGPKRPIGQEGEGERSIVRGAHQVEARREWDVRGTSEGGGLDGSRVTPSLFPPPNATVTATKKPSPDTRLTP